MPLSKWIKGGKQGHLAIYLLDDAANPPWQPDVLSKMGVTLQLDGGFFIKVMLVLLKIGLWPEDRPA